MPQIVLDNKPPYERIRSDAFWGRFTNGEPVDFDVAMRHDPAASSAAKKAAAKLRVFQRQTDMRGFVRLKAQKVVDFVNALAPAVLTSARVTEILSTEVTAAEAYIVPGEMQ